jgi:hypothetical protein
VVAWFARLTLVVVAARSEYVHNGNEGFVLPSLVHLVLAVHKPHGVKARMQLKAAALELVLIGKKGADGFAVHFDVHVKKVTK